MAALPAPLRMPGSVRNQTVYIYSERRSRVNFRMRVAPLNDGAVCPP